MRINFISNLPLSQQSGGWSGISHSLHEQLCRAFEVHFCGPVNPPAVLWEKAISKARRVVGGRGRFFFFSERRLAQIDHLVSNTVDPRAEYNFFHGVTPWIAYQPERPYGAYVDATFRTYIEVYHDASRFDVDDLHRIEEREHAWLERANHVFWGSNWALDRAVNEYGLNRDNAHVVWVGGQVPVPDEDVYEGGLRFLFIALDFERKGGRIAVEALQHVRQQYPQAEMVVLGEQPPSEVRALPGVSYGGFLRKTDTEELDQFARYLATARGLIHPTTMDTMGMVLIEGAYFGCPSISTRTFGVPELVIDGETGYLVDPPPTVEAVAERMLQMCEDEGQYQEMRTSARAHATQRLSWDALGRRLHETIAPEHTRQL